MIGTVHTFGALGAAPEPRAWVRADEQAAGGAPPSLRAAGCALTTSILRRGWAPRPRVTHARGKTGWPRGGFFLPYPARPRCVTEGRGGRVPARAIVGADDPALFNPPPNPGKPGGGDHV